jgi:hypothetical protein
MDNEGFEAEVFFTTGLYAAGQARVRQAGCEDRWDIDLVLIDPDDEPSGTTPVPRSPDPSGGGSGRDASATKLAVRVGSR